MAFSTTWRCRTSLERSRLKSSRLPRTVKPMHMSSSIPQTTLSPTLRFFSFSTTRGLANNAFLFHQFVAEDPVRSFLFLPTDGLNGNWLQNDVVTTTGMVDYTKNGLSGSWADINIGTATATIYKKSSEAAVTVTADSISKTATITSTGDFSTTTAVSKCNCILSRDFYPLTRWSKVLKAPCISRKLRTLIAPRENMRAITMTVLFSMKMTILARILLLMCVPFCIYTLPLLTFDNDLT